jgi:hypothetical protein
MKWENTLVNTRVMIWLKSFQIFKEGIILTFPAGIPESK